MSKTDETLTASNPTPSAADLQDERLLRDQGIGGAAKAFIRRVRGGDIGSLPVVVGLIVIWAVFQALSPEDRKSVV